MNIPHSRLTFGVLAGQPSYNWGLNQFLRAIFRGINVAAHEADCHLLFGCGINLATTVRNAWPVVDPENAFVPIGPWNTDGLIAILPFNSPERSRYIRTCGHPVVMIGASETGPAVAPDNAGGIRQAMAHLVEVHGHRRIAFLAGGENDPGDSSERLHAYQEAVRQYGLSNDPQLIAFGYHYWQASLEAARRLVQQGGDFTAIVASNDIAARAAIAILQEAGRRVPEDVAVIGFDDQADARGANPLLTTVHHPMFEIGYHALGLLQQIVTGTATPETIICVPTRLVIRQSCGCSGASPRQIEQAPAMPGITELAQNMAERVVLETSYFQPAELRTWCDRLVHSWYQSINNDDPAHFQQTLQNILQRAEELSDDVHAWQTALSALKDTTFAGSGRATSARQAAWLDAARIEISERIRREYSYSVTHRWAVDDMVSSLTARMLAVEDEAALVRLFNEDFPSIGIRYLRALLFEPDETDPVAWSTPLGASESDPIQRFPTRIFPPPHLYPDDTRLSLGIVPLIFQGTEKQLGFVTFELERLSQYPMFIAEHLTAAIKTLRLYRDAEEGRRLAEEGRRLAEEADRQKSRFLATVSHELRTPLSLIVGMSELLMDSQIPVQPEDLQQIHSSAQHLGWLIRDVLDMASSEAKRLRLFHEPLNLVSALQPAFATSSQLAHKKGLSWHTKLPKTEIWVLGDRARLCQVVLNLVSNAVKFTTKGKIALTIEPGENDVSIYVQDTGLGISPEAQAYIFNEFHQVEHASQHQHGGLGLGLTICKRLVEMHGGQIGVQSSGVEGQGSVFYFSLPRLNPSTIPPAPAQVVPDGKNAILVLWNAEADAEALRSQLTAQGIEVDTIPLGDEDTWFPRLLESPPGAIVLDLPQASEQAWNIFQKIKEHPATRGIPLLFYAPASATGAFLAFDYLSKPLALNTLTEALDRYGLLTANNETRADERKTILVVDDDPGILKMHARMLQTIGPSYQVLQARHGKEAIATAVGNKIDLILLDLMMPGMDGFAVLEALCAGVDTRDIPVIVLTAQILSETDMARLSQGVISVLSKGVFSLHETMENIQAVLTNRRKPGSEAQRLMRSAMAYIHTHYAKPISRENIAQHVGISPGHLNRCFNQELQISPMTYLTRYRLNQAKTLLTDSELSVADVSEKVGFADVDYFGRVFRQEMGVSPGAYRRGKRKA